MQIAAAETQNTKGPPAPQILEWNDNAISWMALGRTRLQAVPLPANKDEGFSLRGSAF